MLTLGELHCCEHHTAAAAVHFPVQPLDPEPPQLLIPSLYHDQMVSSTGRLVLPPLCVESGSTPLYPLPPLPPFLEKTSATDSQVSENTVYQT